MTRSATLASWKPALRLALIAGLCVTSLSCDPLGDAAVDLEKRSWPILHGETSGADQDFVVTIGVHEASSVCTGTLVAPNLVITARHCVSRIDEEGFACWPDGTPEGASATPAKFGADYTPGELYVWTGNKQVPITPTLKGEAYGQAILHDDGTNACGHDVAFIILDRALNNVPVAPLRLLKKTKANEVLEAIGFGVTETGEMPAFRQKRGGLSVWFVGPWASGSGLGLSANEFGVGESQCDGDSGGPVIAKSGAVVGIASRGHGGEGTSGCENQLSVYMDTSGFKALADRAFAQAGAVQWLEGEANPYTLDAGTPEPDAGSPLVPADAAIAAGPDAAAVEHADAGGVTAAMDAAVPASSADTDPGSEQGCTAAGSGSSPSAISLFLAVAWLSTRRLFHKSSIRSTLR